MDLDDYKTIITQASGTIRYDNSSDYIQVLYNNSWKNWMRGGMKELLIYDNGNEYIPLDWTYTLNSYTKATRWTRQSNHVFCESVPSGYYGIIGIQNQVDIRPYTYLRITYEHNGGTVNSYTNLTSVNGTSAFIAVCVVHTNGLLVLVTTQKSQCNTAGIELARIDNTVSGNIKLKKLWLSNNLN